MKTIAPVLLLGGLLAACNGDPEPAAAVEDEAGAFDPLTEQVDKAKAVEGQVMEQKEALDEALEEAEGAAADPTGEAADPME